MINWDIISAVIFYLIIFGLFLKFRNKFEVQGKIFVMYKTKLGLKLMDYFAKKFPRTLKVLSYFSVGLGFVGMISVLLILVKGAINLIKIPDSQPMLAPLLPGIQIPGLPTLSFWHWVIGILIVAVIHESFHGIFARLYNIKIKSSGFAFLGPILAAFVEPDEKELNKATKFQQLSVLSAGAFSNIISGIIIILIGSLVLTPVTSSMFETSGVQIISISEDLPINSTDVKIGETIRSINGIKIENVKDFIETMDVLKPGEIINLMTDNTSSQIPLVQNPQNTSRALLGVTVTHTKINLKENIKEKYGSIIPSFILWLSELLFWLYVISLGVGFFNLLPLGPVDGGKMFYVGIQYFIKDKKKALKVYSYMTSFCTFLIIINLLPYVIKIFKFILSPII